MEKDEVRTVRCRWWRWRRPVKWVTGEDEGGGGVVRSPAGDGREGEARKAVQLLRGK